MATLRVISTAAVAVTLFASCGAASAQKQYDPGASDTEIKVGNTMPYSGPASIYSVIGKVEAGYFKMINEQGGIKGRKINFISYDDAYSPPKAVEQARKLVESDEVLLIFNSFGTPSNVAIQKYLNARKVPQLFVASGAAWGDPKNFPWTMGWQPPYQSEGRIYAKYLLQEKPQAKIGVLYQNDGLGKELLKGLKDGLGDKTSRIVLEESYETSEPTIESHVVKLKASGADTLIHFATPKFAAQAIRKAAELNWKPLQIIGNVSVSIGATIKPAGFENAQGLISATYAKDGSDPQWDDDPGMQKFYAFLSKYVPEANKVDSSAVYGYAVAQSLVKVLQECGDDLTRENIMKQASSLNEFSPDLLLPGIKINTSTSDFYPLKQLRLMRLKGDNWELFGDVISGEIGKSP
ncbi:ABC transporter substrate-binding protein [Bradyrhizobium manausense]